MHVTSSTVVHALFCLVECTYEQSWCLAPGNSKLSQCNVSVFSRDAQDFVERPPGGEDSGRDAMETGKTAGVEGGEQPG